MGALSCPFLKKFDIKPSYYRVMGVFLALRDINVLVVTCSYKRCFLSC